MQNSLFTHPEICAESVKQSLKKPSKIEKK